MVKLKKVQKEVQFLKVLVEDYQGGRDDDRYRGFIDKLNGYKRDLQGKVLFISKNLRDSILDDIEYCLKTLNSRVDKASAKDILINKINYELEKLLPSIQQFSGKRNDIEFIQYQDKLSEFSHSLHALKSSDRNLEEVKELLVRIGDCLKILENAARRNHAMNSSKSMDELRFEHLNQTPSRAANRSTPSNLNKAGLDLDDENVANNLDDLEMEIHKIKLNYALIRPDDVEKLDKLSKQILETYNRLERLAKTSDQKQEQKKQSIGRTLISLNKKISMDKKEAESKIKPRNILNEVPSRESMMTIETRTTKFVEDKSEKEQKKQTHTEIVENSNYFLYDSTQNHKENKTPSAGLLQRTVALRAQWESLKADVFDPSADSAEIMEIVDILRDIKNDIFNQMKLLQTSRRLSRTINVRYSNPSLEDIPIVLDEKPKSQILNHKVSSHQNRPKSEVNSSEHFVDNLEKIRNSYPSVEKLVETYEPDRNRKISATERSISFARTQIQDEERPEPPKVEVENTTPSKKKPARLIKSLPPPPPIILMQSDEFIFHDNSSINLEEPKRNSMPANAPQRNSVNYSSLPPKSKSKEFLNGLSYKDYSLSIQNDAKLLTKNNKETFQPHVYGSIPNINKVPRRTNDFEKSSSQQDLQNTPQRLPVKIYENPNRFSDSLFYSFENLSSQDSKAEVINISSNEKKTITNFTLRTRSVASISEDETQSEDPKKSEEEIKVIEPKEETKENITKSTTQTGALRYNIADFLFPTNRVVQNEVLDADNEKTDIRIHERGTIKREDAIEYADQSTDGSSDTDGGTSV